MSNKFPYCNLQIDPDHIKFPLTTSLGTYSIMDVTACIAHDCWGIYIKREADNSIETICNMYYYYDNMNRSYDIHQQCMEQYEKEEYARKKYICEPGLLVEKIACGDTLVIMLHKVQPISIQATRISEINWNICVFIKSDRRLSNRFSFDPSDIQHIEEKKIDQYKQKIETLKDQVKGMDNIIQTLESKHKATQELYHEIVIEKTSLQVKYKNLEKQIEQLLQEKNVPEYKDESISKEKTCCLS